MPKLRIDNVSIVVGDLQTAVDFFTLLGLELEGEITVEGTWVDSVLGLTNVQSKIALMRAPAGDCRLELSEFLKPSAIQPQATTQVNTVGLHRLMFGVQNIDSAVALLLQHGAELVGEVTQYEDKYRLCYMRGPSNIVFALAEEI